MPQKLVNVSMNNKCSPYRPMERERGWKSKEAKTTQVGQSIVKDSQVKEIQKGRGNINTLVLHLRAF